MYKLNMRSGSERERRADVYLPFPSGHGNLGVCLAVEEFHGKGDGCLGKGKSGGAVGGRALLVVEEHTAARPGLST
jgi:hypothetical protein